MASKQQAARKKRRTFPRYMMGTSAFAGGDGLLDISRDKPDLCHIEREVGDNYIGAWQTGYGFVEVRFPKATTRNLTRREIAHYARLKVDAPWMPVPQPALAPRVAAGPWPRKAVSRG